MSASPPTEIMYKDVQIIYEDNHLIAVNKKSGQIVQGDKTGDKPLSDLVKEYLKEKYNKPGNVYLGVVHRLDRPTSGVVLFAKTSKAAARLSEMFKKHQADKRYWAVTKSPVDTEKQLLTHYLKKNQKQNKSYVSELPKPNFKEARLAWEVVSKSNAYTLFEIKLFTGRHHQIRAQLAHIGHPIKGDLKYGAKRSNPDGSISLHARSISFVHPVKKEHISITARVPDEKLWQFFESSQ